MLFSPGNTNIRLPKLTRVFPFCCMGAEALCRQSSDAVVFTFIRQSGIDELVELKEREGKVKPIAALGL